MPVFLTFAYIIFTTVPLGLWISIYLRKKRMDQDIKNLGHAYDVDTGLE